MATHGSIYSLLKRLDALAEGEFRIIQRSDKLQLVHEQVRRQLERSHKVYERQYNLRAKERTFKTGQEVYRRNFAQSRFSDAFNAKLAPKFLKCRIVKRVGSSIYQVEDMQGKTIGNVHAKDLKV